MENKSPRQALQGTFTASLAAKYRMANNYSAVGYPSLPNYLLKVGRLGQAASAKPMTDLIAP